MPHVAWTLQDLSTSTPATMSFEINPNTFSPPGTKAGITWMRTTAPNGQSLIWQGLNDVPEGKMSGAVNSSGFKASLDEWATKWYPLVLTDDLGNTFNILITAISWTRLNRHLFPHRYDYDITFVIV